MEVDCPEGDCCRAFTPQPQKIEILNPLQLQVLKAKSPKLPQVLTFNWALGCDGVAARPVGLRSFKRLLGTST